jgi:hypothetical protein
MFGYTEGLSRVKHTGISSHNEKGYLLPRFIHPRGRIESTSTVISDARKPFSDIPHDLSPPDPKAPSRFSTQEGLLSIASVYDDPSLKNLYNVL